MVHEAREGWGKVIGKEILKEIWLKNLSDFYNFINKQTKKKNLKWKFGLYQVSKQAAFLSSLKACAVMKM